MGRNYLAHASGDAINAVLAAAGCSPPPRMAEAFVAQNPDCLQPNYSAQIRLKSGSSRPTNSPNGQRRAFPASGLAMLRQS